MGLGSLTFLSTLIERNQIDKKDFTLITFASNRELIQLLGFQNSILIRHSNFWVALFDCLKVIMRVRRCDDLSLVDLERGSYAVGTFRFILSIMKRSTVTCFENTIVESKMNNFISYPINLYTVKEMFLLGIKDFQISNHRNDTKEVSIIKNKLIINCNASNYLLARRYPKEKFILLIEALANLDSGLKFFLTGSASERKYVQEIANQLERKNIETYNVAGKWNITELVSELSTCSMLITCDSAPLHLSVYLKTPTIAIWGPTRPTQFGYERLEFIQNVFHNIECSPCLTYLHSSPAKACKSKITCMKELENTEILNQAIRLIKSQSTTRFVTPFPDQK